MFKKYPNHQEVNKLIKSFSPVFDFNSGSEINTYENEKNYGDTIYKMTSQDGWSCTITFCNKAKNVAIQRHYHPEIIFTKIEKVKGDYESHLNDLKQKNKQIADHLQKLYKPNYERLFHIIDLFTKSGTDSGMLNNLVMKSYRKHLKSHIETIHHKNSFAFNDRNIGIISFNPLLQKDSIYVDGYLKQSYITVSVIYLVDKDNILKPYFKLRLPYSENKKGTCLFPLSGDFKAYFPESDNDYMNKFIDELSDIAADDDSFNEILQDKFLKEVKSTISKTLKIDKKELENSTIDELKDYFIIVEMLKI